MKSSKSEVEWNANCDKVWQASGGGYPSFWYEAIVESCIADDTAAKFGSSTDMKLTSLGSRPITNIFGRPNSMPIVGANEQVVGIYDQGLGEKSMVCHSLEQMQSL